LALVVGSKIVGEKPSKAIPSDTPKYYFCVQAPLNANNGLSMNSKLNFWCPLYAQSAIRLCALHQLARATRAI